MSESELLRAKYRAVLTDTLPYEVPVIFSNDKMFANLISPQDDVAGKLAKRVYEVKAENSKAFSYSISKDAKRTTTLSIVHPIMQAQMATFYSSFQLSMLSGCQKSNFTLRKPNGETPIYSQDELSGDKTFKHGIAHIDPTEGEIDVSHVASYFSYGKYNLLGKFYDSLEFRRLEKRFRYMKSLDVSRCFFNIYTHSISWAVKGKDFSKKNKGSFSFESSFDRLMQECNYGETNGIVVGPEISRIFAEIILQDIDVKVEDSFPDLQNNKDYAVRRYVDDYILFANSIDNIEYLERKISENLEKYKLFLNANKTENYVRPFVSPTSRLRGEIGIEIQAIYDDVDQAVSSTDSSAILNISKSISRRLDSIRRSSATHSAPLHSVSGWLLSNLRNVISKVISHAKKCDRSCENALFRLLSALFDFVFHICSLDLRVRTTYSLNQILEQVSHLKRTGHIDLIDRTLHLISEEMSVLVRSALSLPQDLRGGVELCNILIGGNYYLGDDFMRTKAAIEAIDHITDCETPTYFHFITLKFCMKSRLDSKIGVFMDKIVKRLKSDKDIISSDSEAFLLFSDIMSCPYIDSSLKREIYTFYFGGNPSKSDVAAAGERLAFVDWNGMSISHTLARKALRPVYSWT